MSDRVYRCLVVTEVEGPEEWCASATVAVDNETVGFGMGRGETEAEAASYAAQRAMQAAVARLNPRMKN